MKIQNISPLDKRTNGGGGDKAPPPPAPAAAAAPAPSADTQGPDPAMQAELERQRQLRFKAGTLGEFSPTGSADQTGSNTTDQTTGSKTLLGA